VAETPEGERIVVKIPLPEHRTSRELAVEFASQFEISKVFQHEHVVRVLETGRVSGSPYQALEWVQGENLRTVVHAARTSGESLELSVALRLALQVCRALTAAHSTLRPSLRRPSSAPAARGDTIVHGDLSLENMLLSPSGQVKILPFGCAPPPPSAAVTQPAGQVVPLHLAPEIIAGEAPDVTADLWALGTLLYELLAPALPDGFRTARGPMGWWRLGLLPPLDQLRPDVPSEIALLAASLLEADPSKRLQRAELVEEELVWALTAHGDRQLPRNDGGPDGPLTDDDEHIETLDLDLDDETETVADISEAVADSDDTAGVLGIQMVGAQSTPLASVFTDTDMEMQPLREQARDEGLRPPLLPDEELWIGPDDNPLLGPDAARATWTELQAWGESHEAEVTQHDEGFGLDGPVTDDDGLGLWGEAAHVPTLDGLNALEGPAVAAGLRAAGPDALGPDPYGPESHSVRAPHTPAPPAEETPRHDLGPPKRRKKRKRKRRRKVVARPRRRSRTDLYILVASVTMFLSALLLFLAVMLR
jgi:serine/threonine protein kinase